VKRQREGQWCSFSHQTFMPWWGMSLHGQGKGCSSLHRRLPRNKVRMVTAGKKNQVSRIEREGRRRVRQGANEIQTQSWLQSLVDMEVHMAPPRPCQRGIRQPRVALPPRRMADSTSWPGVLPRTYNSVRAREAVEKAGGAKL